MERIQIGEMLEVGTKQSERYGEILVLNVKDSETGTCFDNVETREVTGHGEVLSSVDIRITKQSARKLAQELLKLAGEA